MRDPLAADILARKFDDFIVLWFHSSEQERANFVTEAQAMDYKKFLNTEYWQVVRAKFVKLHGSLCRRCGRSTHDLHHHTYEHHGLEHLHLGDLELLCHDCHAIIHAGGSLPHRRFAAMTESEKSHFYETAKWAEEQLSKLGPTPRIKRSERPTIPESWKTRVAELSKKVLG